MNKRSLFQPINRSAHEWAVLFTTRARTRRIRHFAFQQFVCLRQTAVIYATFPFVLAPLCQITTGSLTSLTLHTLHSIEVGWGGGGGAPCLVPRGTVQLQGRQRLLRDRLRRWSKQATYSAAMGSRGVSPRAHVAFSLFTQVKRDWGSSCKCRNTHRIYNRKAHT